METSFKETFKIISKDVIIEIIKFLDYRDVIRFCASQKSKLYYICQKNEDIIWRFLLERDFFVDPTTVPNGTAKISYIKLAQGRQVWTFGHGGEGRLGHGNNDDVFTPKAIEGFNNIVQVSCGWTHTAIIDSTGQIWTFGKGNFGKLGHSNTDDISIPKAIKGFNDIIQVSCGVDHTAMIDSKNQVWTWGSGSLGRLGHGNEEDVWIPKAIKGFNDIVQVSCGSYYTAMIDSKNQVWTWGFGNLGQLGHNSVGNELIPKTIKGFNNIVQISCGSFHTAMIDVTGQVWTFGWGLYGQLGHPNLQSKFILVPTPIERFNNIVQVSCGYFHTAMVDSMGQVWTWGAGGDGQLGHNNISDGVLIPKAIKGFDNIVQVHCGRNYTVMIDVTGQIWTFGWGLLGQLGHNNTDDVLIPAPIKGFNNIIQISCKGSHTAITFE